MSDGREAASSSPSPKNVTGKGVDGRLDWAQFLVSADRLLRVSGAVGDHQGDKNTKSDNKTASPGSSVHQWTLRKISVSVISSRVCVHVCLPPLPEHTLCLCVNECGGSECVCEWLQQRDTALYLCNMWSTLRLTRSAPLTAQNRFRC